MKRAAIIVTDAVTLSIYEGYEDDPDWHPREPEYIDPSEELLADLRYLVNAAPGPESARVRAALGDDDA